MTRFFRTALVALVGSVFLLDSTVADIVDLDEAITGAHREGLYFGFWRMSSKLARALGLVLTGLILDLGGYVPGAAEQSSSAATGIARAFGPGVGVLYVASAFLWLLVPTRRSVQERVRRIVARRRDRSDTTARLHSSAIQFTNSSKLRV